MRIVIDRGDGTTNEFLAAWAARKIGNSAFAKPYQCIGLMRGERLEAVAVYNNLMTWPGGGNVMIHFAAESPRWASKQAVRVFLDYPFAQLKCNRITAFVARSNKRSRRLAFGLGFKPEGVMRQAAPKFRNVFVYGLTRDDYEQGKFGYVERRARTAGTG